MKKKIPQPCDTILDMLQGLCLGIIFMNSVETVYIKLYNTQTKSRLKFLHYVDVQMNWMDALRPYGANCDTIVCAHHPLILEH